MKLTFLDQPGGIRLVPADGNKLVDALRQWELASPGERVVRIVRGNKCGTASKLFDEWAAALQFPQYFGENWDAFNECLTDGSQFPKQATIVIAVVDSDLLLDAASAKAVSTCAEVLNSCFDEVNKRSNKKPGQSMHLVFHCEPRVATANRKRWSDAGLILADSQ